MELIRAIDFDFNVESFYKSLYEIIKVNAAEQREQTTAMFHISRTVLLDLVKCGASLFYDSFHLSLAAFLITHFFLTGWLTRHRAPAAPRRRGGEHLRGGAAQ